MEPEGTVTVSVLGDVQTWQETGQRTQTCQKQPGKWISLGSQLCFEKGLGPDDVQKFIPARIVDRVLNSLVVMAVKTGRVYFLLDFCCGYPNNSFQSPGISPVPELAPIPSVGN